ncbi:hypothetical protein [Parabacteroides pacaensis]|uniref:hypothetical protein n=1 Tax=Parabacteroides pacaensis TaxID=2086575 RepID=UPI00131CBD51|nr:hypothetical protein [Parabacteroides pacaensis]
MTDGRLEQILQSEMENTNHIHLFLLSSADIWAAYEQSAINLQVLEDKVKETWDEEIFPEAEVRLKRVLLSNKSVQRYICSPLCILLEKDHIELSLASPVEVKP